MFRYLWRDQFVDYILQVIGGESENRYQEKILLLGNSIGGFTAASTAAKLQSNYGFNNISLVLVNSAGKIIEGGSGGSFFYSLDFIACFLSQILRSRCCSCTGEGGGGGSVSAI